MIDHEPLDSLDDAIDRTLRDMTHVAADDDGVARVMARVREAGARDGRVRGAGARDASAVGGRHWRITPRVAWSSMAALLLMLLLTNYAWRPLNRGDDEQSAAVITSSPSSGAESSTKPPLATREIPTPTAAPPSTVQATTARGALGHMVRPASVANGAADPSDRVRDRRDSQQEPALESDIVVANIAPVPLGDAPAIPLAPLITSSLKVDAIPVSSIDLPPVSPERH